MQYSIVNHSELERTYRLDAEYFSSDYIMLDKVLLNKQCSSLNLFAKISDGNHMKIANTFLESGIPYYRGQDLKSFFLEDTVPKRIPLDIYNNYWMERSYFKVNDILLSIVGTVGNISFVTNEIGKSTGSCKIAILRPNNFKYAKYLCVFLMSKYGQFQIHRNTRGAVQKGLILEDFDQIKVFESDENFYDVISKFVNKCLHLNRKSKRCIKTAQNILLEELALLEYKPTHTLSYVKNYSDTQNAERIDAEYFQPKYDEVVTAIKNAYSYDRLDNIVSYKKGYEVGSKEYIDRGIPFIRVSNISPMEMTEEKYIANEMYTELSQYQPMKDEILLSKDGTPGISYHIFDNPKAMIISSGILKLSIRRKDISPEYLTLVLNSLTTQYQIQRDVGGSIIKHWRPEQVDATLIPIIEEQKRDEITQLVIEARKLRLKAKQLLEIAKKGVEIAIEQDEDIAIEWMEEKVKEIGVELE